MPSNNVNTPVMRQYLACKEAYPDAILFFRLGDFYEMFFEDAVVASSVLDLVLTSRDKGKKNPVPMCGVPHHAMRGYVARLVESGHKVAICDQVEDPKKAKGIVKREVTEVVTPGVILDAEQLEAKQSNFLLALAGIDSDSDADPEAAGPLGLAFLDASTGEFLSTELSSGDAVADELARIHPSQVLVPPGAEEALARRVPGLRRLAVEAAPNGVFGAPIEDRALLFEAAATAGSADVDVDVDVDGGWMERAPAARRACAAVIRYLRSIFPGRTLPPFRIVPYTPSAYLVLDEATIANLEIFETLMERKRQGSLISVLDRTVTPMGYGGDLPTEAQWEKAARGTTPTKYPWGDTPEPNCTLANYDFNGGDPDASVPQMDAAIPGYDAGPPADAEVDTTGYGCAEATTGPGTWDVGDAVGDEDSPYGAVDMAGNVAEWTRDCYDASVYSTCQSGCSDPVNTSTGCGYRVVRGGSFVGREGRDFTKTPLALRVVAREFLGHDDVATSYREIGFRCVRPVP